MTYRRAHTGPGQILLVIDHADADFPAMVYSANGTAEATYFDAVDGEELHARFGGVQPLSPGQLTWLARFREEAVQAYDMVAQ
jgi:hypothetical protein